MKSSIHFTNRTMMKIKRHKIRAKFGLKASVISGVELYSEWRAKVLIPCKTLADFTQKHKRGLPDFFCQHYQLIIEPPKKLKKTHHSVSVANINRIKTLTKRSSIKVSLTSLLFVTIVTRTVVGPCSWNWICSF